eukprot:CAMPEP_0176237924 /NCGR_PEP_ID=MMETSP0121_2-20121125/28100_1 /TAXON_ID=160619 /ORGANISM="Kryptoperidinium foliaceum, Strain CCMP 1326" /LENGTH=153 /DNA_ID=CAMNT_0017577383 /DNA_START=17 /DNA_END=478 /DNA_ORIENTATION=+
MQEAVRQDWRAMQDLLAIRNPPTQAQIEELVALNPSTLQVHELRTNRGAALAGVRADGMALRYVDPDLRKDEEVVREAMQQKPEAWFVSHPIARYDPKLQDHFDSGPMRRTRERNGKFGRGIAGRAYAIEEGDEDDEEDDEEEEEGGQEQEEN